MTVLVLAGTIGAGKSSLTEMLAEELNTQAFMKVSMTIKSCPYSTRILKNMPSYYKYIFLTNALILSKKRYPIITMSWIVPSTKTVFSFI